MNINLQNKLTKIFSQQKNNFKYNWREDFKSDPQVTRIESELNGYGPLDPLLADEAITEILANSFEHIYFEREAQLWPCRDRFYSEQTYEAALERLAQHCGTYLSREKPFVEAQYKNWRITLIFAEISRGTPLLSIRKQPEQKWSLRKLLETNFLNLNQKEIIEELLEAHKNILIVGGTGSGKTSLLQALLSETSASERCVIIEDTQELQLPNPLSSSLLTRQDPANSVSDVSMNDLLKRALRLRPDRLIVGEIRGSEAQALLLALSSGHSGSLGSLHALSASDALIRLEMLVQMGAPQWSLHSVRRLMAMTVDYIIVVAKKNKKRSITGIYKISSLEEIGFTTELLENS